MENEIIIQGARHRVELVIELAQITPQLAAHMKARGFDAYGYVDAEPGTTAVAYRSAAAGTWHVVERIPAAATLGAVAKRTRAEESPSPAAVKRLRESASLTQEAFGALVYKGYRVVQEWESDEGRRRCPPDTFELLTAKVKASELLRRGRISPQAVKDIGLKLPELD